MLNLIAKKIFGTVNERTVKKFQKLVDEINALEQKYIGLDDEGLKAQTNIFCERLKAGESLNDILPAAFAVVREAAKRTLGQRHFDVQLIGGIVLHRGMIAEMKTGEGKTLVATLASYLNALEGKGVHVVTVNDYLAKTHADWMGEIHRFLGLTVGCIVHDLNDDERKAAYDCDITYGTNNEFGFDYLRDNMKFSASHMVQRGFNFAIVDEVDSILIDEARTPLIISGPTEDNSKLYQDVTTLIPSLKSEDYMLEEKEKSVSLSDEGNIHMEELLKSKGIIDSKSNLYDVENIKVVHHVNQALKAHKMFNKDTDYIVKDGQVIIIDEFTGRMQPGRRFSDGLHQSLEAKEGVTVQNENQTLASITFQNYFRMFDKLSGMTGTAVTEALEFEEIYSLKTVVIPTNKPIDRIDEDDEIYRSEEEKYKAIVNAIKECYERKQPVLVGTVSIEKSEKLAKMLKAEKIPHNVLNAKYHEMEAHIIAQAGFPGAITIATNMAGRGTDIMLGGNADMIIAEKFADVNIEELSGNEKKEYNEAVIEIKKKVEEDKRTAIEAGGLYIVGTERHESRRIDNQLRGRSGRQGDPGHSKFFLSLQDDLMRIFGSERLEAMLGRIGFKEDEAIKHPWISKSLEKAQEKVEGRHYEIRKNLLKYDDVVNEQRKIVFEQRADAIKAEDMSPEIEYMRSDLNRKIVSTYIPLKSYIDQWDLEGLDTELFHIYSIHMNIQEFAKNGNVTEKEVLEEVEKRSAKHFKEKEEMYGAKMMRQAERQIFLVTIDNMWKDHLLSLDHLRQGINLRAYGQKQPLNEYKEEAFALFETMLYGLGERVIRRMAHLQIRVDSSQSEEESDMLMRRLARPQRVQESRVDPAAVAPGTKNAIDLVNAMNSKVKASTPVRSRQTSGKINPNDPSTWGRVNRNDPCPCGSGKKYKQCHGKD